MIRLPFIVAILVNRVATTCAASKYTPTDIESGYGKAVSINDSIMKGAQAIKPNPVIPLAAIVHPNFISSCALIIDNVI